MSDLTPEQVAILIRHQRREQLLTLVGQILNGFARTASGTEGQTRLARIDRENAVDNAVEMARRALDHIEALQ